MKRKACRRAEALARTSNTARNTRVAIARRHPVAQTGSGRLSTALLSTAAAGVMMIAQSHIAQAGPDACVTAGTVATCGGNQSDGITNQGGTPDFTTPPVETLNVNNLNQAIAPAAGIDGIIFSDGGATTGITVNVDTGSFGIVTSGNDGDGIDVDESRDGSVTVNSTGDIRAFDNGIDIEESSVGSVTVNQTGNITTTQGDGIQIDEFGGGGVSVMSTGNISSAGGLGIIVDEDEDGDVGVTSDGNITSAGGDGIGVSEGDSGNVSIMSTGNISANGGGGDNDSIAVSEIGVGDVTITSIGNLSANGGGSGNDGIDASEDGDGDLTVTSTGNITANGGGTSNGGIDVREDDDGNLSVTSTGDIRTTDDISEGIKAEEDGIGNATLSSKGNIKTIGNGSDGIEGFEQDSGSLSITSSGNITTMGVSASGIDGAENNAGSLRIMSSGNIMTTGGGDAAGIEAFELDSGDISIASTGNITTVGDVSEGIEAFEGDGGDVTVTSTGNITTTGDNSQGIDAVENDAGTLAVTSNGNISTTGTSSDGIFVNGENGGGSVTVTSTGNITTQGSGADGISANSDGGGNISVTSNGNITASGNNAAGVSISGTAGTNNTVTLASGTIQGGTGANGAGVNLGGDPGSTNKLDMAAGVTVSALSGTAISGSAGDDSVHNFGTVIGNVDLGGGTNAFKNMAGGLFDSGMTVNLGAGNLLTNDGTLSPGGVGVVATSTLTGNIVQSASGILLTTVDSTAQMADLLNVTGTATLAGNVQASIINPAFGLQTQTVLTATGGVTNNSLGLIASPALQAQLLFPNANDVQLQTDIDFTPDGVSLNPNQTNIATNINAILDTGNGDVLPVVLALLNGPANVAEYLAALDQLSPEAYLNAETVTLFATEEFTNNLLSCKVPGSGAAFIREGQCVWVRPEGRFLDRDRTANNIGFDEKSGGLSAGAQFALAPGWHAGFGLGYEYGTLDTDTGVESSSRRYSIGGALKYQQGNFLLAGAVSGGVADFYTTRRVTFGGLNLTPTSDYDITYVAGQLRAAYLMSNGNWYAKPLVDLNLTHLDRDDSTEVGGGAANLAVSGGKETFFSVTPALEVGTQYRMAPDITAKPFVKAGMTFYSDDSHALTANFVNAPAGVGAFAISSEFDDTFFDLETGLTLLKDNGTSLEFGYEGRFAGDTETHGGFVKGTVKF